MSKLAAQLQLSLPLEALPPRYNIAPTQDIAAIRQRIDGQRELVQFHWDLIPAWTKDLAKKPRMINARAETLAEKPTFKGLLRKRRCLIPADGFYEWQPAGKAKRPYYIHLKDQPVFAFAGLWDCWSRPDAPAIESCTIITCGPNELMRGLHDRMPVILSPADYDRWLDAENQDTADLLPLLNPYPASEMAAYPVTTTVNNPRSQGEACVAPLVES
jgi:putative SOS response-associated peptidase YedK